MTVRAIDTLLAVKVLNVMPGLSSSDRRVGVALIEHFNRKTGRCDPGIDRIAKLLGLCTRTIIRSTNKLQKMGLFSKVRHGGYSNRNSYQPNWPRFAELEEAWRQKMKLHSLSRRPGLSSASRQPCHIHGDNGVAQTCIANLQKQTCSTGWPNGSNGAARANRSGSGTISSRNAALRAAERRWTEALRLEFASRPDAYAQAIEAIDSNMQRAASEAEMRSRGAGLAHILAQLKM